MLVRKLLVLIAISVIGISVTGTAFGFAQKDSQKESEPRAVSGFTSSSFVTPYVTTDVIPDISNPDISIPDTSNIQTIPFKQAVPFNDAYALAEYTPGAVGGNLTLENSGNANSGELNFATMNADANNLAIMSGHDYLPIAAMPEPSEGMVLLCGLLIAGFIARRRLDGNWPAS